MSSASEPRILSGSLPVSEPQKLAGSVTSYVTLSRPHQWAKNALVFVPLLLSHKITEASLLLAARAVVSFSLAASAVYILNDLLDIEADRHHPTKRNRPLASGAVSPVVASAIGITIAIFCVASTFGLSPRFALTLAFYVELSVAYSLGLKRIVILDVMVLSGLYTLRLEAGAAATGTSISPWMAGFSMFLFLSLAMVKRFAEFDNLRATGDEPKNRRGYLISDIDQMRSTGTASAYAAALVFAIYISSKDVTRLYAHPGLLWMAVPLLIYWLNRVWLLAARGEMHEDPVVFALTDRVSMLVGFATICIVALASGGGQ